MIDFQEVPADLPAERYLLGACIESEEILTAVIQAGMDEGDFSVSDHARVCCALMEMKANTCPIDLISLVDHLQSPDSAALIADLTFGVVLHVPHALHHLSILKRKREQREFLAVSELLEARAREYIDPSQVRNHVISMLSGGSKPMRDRNAVAQ